MNISQMKKLFFCFVFLYFVLSCFSSASIAESENSSYIIGKGDVLLVYVWKESELTREVTVMSDGWITFPIIDEVRAAGRTVSELDDAITGKLKNYIDAPDVTIIVQQSNSRRIYIIGKVEEPGPYTLNPDMTVLQAISAAGGFTEWADTDDIMIIRRHQAKVIQIPFNYKQIISKENMEQNIMLQPNDTIIVP